MPDWRAVVRERLAAAALDPAREAEIVDEIAQHVDDRYREALARGLSEADAVREGLAEIDAREHMVTDLARLPTVPPAPPVGSPEPRRHFAGLLQDLKYTVRLLRRSPSFSIAAIVTIALSTGPTIAALGVTNGLFLRPTPGVEDANGLAFVVVGDWTSGGGFRPSWMSYDEVARLNADVRSVRGIAGFAGQFVALSLDRAESSLEYAVFTSANYFDVLGVRMQHGRPFVAEEDRQPGGALVTVLTAGLARRLFGDSSAAIGRTLRVNGELVEVVGVAAAAFRGTSISDQPALWLPGQTTRRFEHLPAAEWAYAPSQGPFYEFIARLAPGATFDRADVELRGRVRALADLPGAGDKYKVTQPALFAGIGVGPFERGPIWELVRLTLWVGIALALLGAANLANLFLWRQARRSQDAAVRRVLGASAGRLARLPVLEALMLAVAGGGLGLVITLAARAALPNVDVPLFGSLDVPMDWRLFGMACATAVVVGLAVSVLPARLAARADLARSLGREGRGVTRVMGRFRAGLAVVQVALSLALLVGALLFVRTLQNINAVDLGFDPHGVTNVRLSLRQLGYAGTRTVAFQREILARVGADPRVESAALALTWPLSGFSRQATVYTPGTDPKSAIRVRMNDIAPDYFRALGQPILAGRSFTEAETFVDGPESGVVVDEASARRLFGGAPAVGRTLIFAAGGRSREQEVPVIGVVSNTRWVSFDRHEMVIYRPLATDGIASAMLVRSSQSPDEVLRLVRLAVGQLDPTVPVLAAALQEAVANRVTAQRIRAWAVGALAAIGFVLAAVGIYGLVAQCVVDRSREFGIRRAVGAGSREVAALVLRQGLLIVAIGVPAGLAASAMASRLVQAQLFGIAPLEPWVYVSAALALTAVALGACLVPARRAMNVDPIEVLRSE